MACQSSTENLMHRVTLSASAICLVLLAGCRDHGQPGGRSEAPPVSPAAGQRDGAPESGEHSLLMMPISGVHPDQLPDPQSAGAELYATYCSGCHELPSPARHSAQDWTTIVRNMVLRMDRATYRGGMMGGGMMGRGSMMGRGGMMGRIEMPSPDQQRTILAYLQAHALRAVPEHRALAGAGSELFQQVCARCHALPDPGQHTAAEWPGVVERMRTHMEQSKIPGITDQQANEIVEYLDRAAEPSH